MGFTLSNPEMEMIDNLCYDESTTVTINGCPIITDLELQDHVNQLS